MSILTRWTRAEAAREVSAALADFGYQLSPEACREYAATVIQRAAFGDLAGQAEVAEIIADVLAFADEIRLPRRWAQ